MPTKTKRKAKPNYIRALVVILSVVVLALFSACPQAGLLTALIEEAKETANDNGDNGSENNGDAVITIAAIPGVTPPVSGETPVTTITETEQYTGTVSWSPDDNPFEYETVYAATITLMAKTGYTFTGVAADFFTVAGADSVSSDADSGVVTAGFPETGVAPLYSVTYNVGTGNTSGTVPVDTTFYSSGATVTVLGNTGELRGAVIRDGIKQRFIGWNTNSGATAADYVADDIFEITESITLYAIYTTGDDVLRKVGPAGGWVFYDTGSVLSWGRYLEAALNTWSGGPEDPAIAWQDPRVLIGAAAQGTAIGTGQSNTTAIVNWLNTNGQTGRAVQVVEDLEFGGYDDWFLPSKDELNQMYVNLHQESVGGFSVVIFWSSSEGDSDSAWRQDFNSGDQGYNWKSHNIIRVRPVRAF